VSALQSDLVVEADPASQALKRDHREEIMAKGNNAQKKETKKPKKDKKK
jgi:hypothetical protein